MSKLKAPYNKFPDGHWTALLVLQQQLSSLAELGSLACHQDAAIHQHWGTDSS